jgi:hypothetical protein
MDVRKRQYVSSFPKAVPILLAFLIDPSIPCDIPADANANLLRDSVMTAAKFFVMPPAFFSWLSKVTVGHDYELISYLNGSSTSWLNRSQQPSSVSKTLIEVSGREIVFKQCSVCVSALSVTVEQSFTCPSSIVLDVTFVDSSGVSHTEKNLNFSQVTLPSVPSLYSVSASYESVLPTRQTNINKITLVDKIRVTKMHVRGFVTLDRDVWRMNDLY